MAGDLYRDLPPPTAPPPQPQQILHSPINGEPKESCLEPPPPPPPRPASALKSSLKRPTPQQREAAPEKRLRFKTTTDASEKQVIEAMQKIGSHIKNPSKFHKASKLAIQLIKAASIKEETRDYLFALLEASMVSVISCNEPSLRGDYHTLFSAAQDVAECLKKQQQNILSAWTIRAVWANDLFTDDSFVFSKATGRIKELISSLPAATKEDDIEEAVALKDETDNSNADGLNKELSPAASDNHEEEDEPDPFGLDALISNVSKKENPKGKKDSLSNCEKGDALTSSRFLKLQREALISCLEIAANRYKTPWCQTTIDILAKHAFDNIARFTSQQRVAIEKLWNSIREQQSRRKQGKSVTGKLDVNGFEWLQQKYATETMSIRRSVGGSGDRRCQQWLG